MRPLPERWLALANIPRLALFAAVLAATLSAYAQSAAQPAGVDRPDRCVGPAATHHRVNEMLLRAILRVESRMKPSTVTTNRNGSIDVGMAGTNSVHFPELKRYGIAPASLLDPCVSTYVAAWHIRRAVQRHGNTWQGVAAYHSVSGPQNHRYRILLHNELVRMGVISDRLMPVPSLSAFARKVTPTRAPAPPATRQPEPPAISRIVFPDGRSGACTGTC